MLGVRAAPGALCGPAAAREFGGTAARLSRAQPARAADAGTVRRARVEQVLAGAHGASLVTQAFGSHDSCTYIWLYVQRT